MSTLKTIVNYSFPVEVPPFSELKTEIMDEFLDHIMKYHWLKQDLEWQLAFEFHLYEEDAALFVAEWRNARARAEMQAW